MIFLILAVFCSTSINLLMKYSLSRNKSGDSITSISYLVSTLVSLGLCLQSGVFSAFKGFSILAGLQDLPLIFNKTAGHNGQIAWTVLLGFILGLIYLSGMFIFQASIRKNGSSLTSMFKSLSFLIPVFLSAIFWNERETGLQLIGIIMAIFALMLFAFNFSEMKANSFGPSILLLLLNNGFLAFTNKLFTMYADPQFKSLFLLVLFTSAVVVFTIYRFIKCRKLLYRGELTKTLVYPAILIGIINATSSFFILLALKELPAVIVYPTLNVGYIILVTLGGMVFYKEQLLSRQKLAMVVTMASVLLVNI